MSEATLEQVERLARHQRLQSATELVLEKLRHNAKSITTEDVQNLTNNAEDGDFWTADIIAAVADLAIRNEEDHQLSTINMSEIVDNLYATVKSNPGDVNTCILKTTQSIVRMMQKAVGYADAPHPELEAELQQESAKIVPRVERGIVQKAEADDLYCLEARTHGLTEWGGLSAIAQSAASRCEQQALVSSVSNNVRSSANSRTLTPQTQPQDDVRTGIPMSEMESIKAQDDAAATEPFHLRKQGSSEKIHEKRGGTSPNPSMRRHQSLSDSTNAPRGDNRYDATLPRLHSYGSSDTSGTSKPENSHPAN